MSKFKYQSNTKLFNLQQLGLNLASSTPEFAQLDVLRSGSVTDKKIVPAYFLGADGLSVPPSIETSELNTLACHVEEADVMMCDRNIVCAKNTENNVLFFCDKHKELS